MDKLADLNYSWVIWIGALSLTWVVTQGLLGYYESRQASLCDRRLAKLMEAWPKEPYEGSPAGLVNALDSAHLKLSTDPDMTVEIKLERATIYGCLLCSALLILTVLVLEAGFLSTELASQCRRVSAWLAVMSALINVLSIQRVASLAYQSDISGALKHLTFIGRD